MSVCWEDHVSEETKPDPLYGDAVQLVREFGAGSCFVLQRRLRIGYARAVLLMDRMEREGIVAPAEGAGPRKVIA